MSFLVATPETVAAAAGNLAGIGSTLNDAIAAAAARTTGVAAAATDEVSHAISRLFGEYGRQFQARSSRAPAAADRRGHRAVGAMAPALTSPARLGRRESATTDVSPE